MTKTTSCFVYLITNLINHKAYVGKTSNTVAGRWRDHRTEARRGVEKHFHRAIRCYGAENFNVQTIAAVDTEEKAYALERIWILLLQTYKQEFGYNMTFGGEGLKPTEEVKRKISETKKSQGLKWSEERRQKQILSVSVSIIADRYNKGENPNKISIDLGISAPTIRKKLRSVGVVLRKFSQKGAAPNRHSISSEKILEAKIKENLSTLQLAKKFNISGDTVRRRLKSLENLASRKNE